MLVLQEIHSWHSYCEGVGVLFEGLGADFFGITAGSLEMTTRITAADILQFRVVSPMRIEIELRNPIEVAFFDLHFDLQICGASTATFAAAAGDRPRILMEPPRTPGSAPVEVDFKNPNS